VAAMLGEPLDIFLEKLLLAANPKLMTKLDALSIGKHAVHLVTESPGFGSKQPVTVGVGFSDALDVVMLEDIKSTTTAYNTVTKKMLRSLYTLAQDTGKASVMVDKGLILDGYEWVRRGFIPDLKGWDSLRKSIKKGLPTDPWYSKLSPSAKVDLDGIIASANPASAFALADMGSIGKQALSADYWDGFLSVNDPEAVGRFLQYLGG